MTVSSPPVSALLLLAELPPTVRAAADRWRAVLAPPAAGRMPAHISLFRHLPGPSAAMLVADVRRLVRANRAPMLVLQPPRLWDRALVIPVCAPELLAMRDTLADWWAPMILPNEQGTPRLHITLAAGLDRKAAEAALPEVTAGFRQAPFMGQALPVRAFLLLPHQPPGVAPLLRAVFPG